jgi:hypothetical protein
MENAGASRRTGDDRIRSAGLLISRTGSCVVRKRRLRNLAKASSGRSRPSRTHITCVLLANAELTAIAGISEPDHAELVMPAGRLAEGFPFLDAFQLRLVIFRFLGRVARLALIFSTYRSARQCPVEPAVGACGALLPRLCRTRHKSDDGDDVNGFHVASSWLANFRHAMTITVGMIGPQRGPTLNPLLIFMSAIRVNSGTVEVRKNAASRPTRACNCLTKRRCWPFIIRLTAGCRAA